MFKDDFFKGEPLCKIGDCEFWGKQLITPELAKEILQSNGKNRKLSLPRVLEYSRMMGGGRWKNTADGITISFDKEGNLTNGQHRLKAIQESGVTIQVFIFRNGNTKAGALDLPFDTGLTRTTSQITGHKPRYENPIKFLIKRYGKTTSALVTVDEIETFLNSLDNDELEVLEKISMLNCTGFDAAVRAAAFFWFVTQRNKEEMLTLLENCCHVGSLTEKEAKIQRYMTALPKKGIYSWEVYRSEKFLHAYALFTDKVDTKAFRDSLIQQVRAWMVGRH